MKIIIQLFAGLYLLELKLLKRVKYMWSASLIFMIVILAGSIIGLFYIGPMRYILSIFAAFAVLYMFSTNARLWYGVYEETR